MSADAPAISVMMTVYNAERYVGAAVESILRQTHTDFELIVIDDGSQDDSRKILEGFAARDERLQLVSRSNTGVSRARNDALNLARGALVAVADADDISLPGRLANQAAFFKAHPEVVCAGGCFEVIDEAGRYLTRLDPPFDDVSIQEQLLGGHTAICQPTAMFRREAADAVAGFDESLTVAEDLDFYLKLGERGALANMDEALVQYRMHPASTTARNREAAIADARTVCESAWRRRGLPPRELPDDFWRPDASRASRFAFFLKCGWWAFDSGARRTALVYGGKSVMAMPLKSNGWRLLACALLKSMAKSPASARARRTEAG